MHSAYSMSRRSSLAAGLAVLVVAPILASSGGPPAQQPPAAAADEAAFYRVFPTDRPSQDARLHRSAVTTDTPVHWEPPYDPVTWLERAVEVRKRVRVAAGMWPYPGATLETAVHRVTDRGDYSVQNVLFHSHFSSFIPGNLYLPKGGPELKPIVLCPHGHWENGRLMERTDEEARDLVARGEERSFEAAKYPLQAGCAQLARMGCIVLMYDMVGYGDLTGWNHEESFNTVEELLRLQNVYGMQFWNSMMALNFAWNLDGVDRSKVAMGGASGGATQTLVLAAAEPRIKAAFAAGMVSDTYQGGCRCENPAHMRVGTSNIEIAAAIAPRALALTGANDWTKDVETNVLPHLKKVWRLIGKEEDVTAKCWPEFGHNYNVHAREMMYNWFNEKLGLGIEGPITEAPFQPIPPAELRVYDAAHPNPPESAKDPAGIQATFTNLSDSQLDQINEETPHRLGVLRGIMFEALRIMLATELPESKDVAGELRAIQRLDGRSVSKLVLSRRGSGEEVPAVLVMPDDWNGTVLVGVSAVGKAEFFGAGDSSLAGAARVVDKGVAFLSPDVLLTGESRNSSGDVVPRLAVDEERHARSVEYTYCYNKTLIAERVHDILTAIAFALSLEGTKTVNLAGTGDAGPWAVMARALVGEIPKVGDGVYRTAAQWSWDFDLIRSTEDQNFLPGGLRYGGIPYFATLIAPAELLILTSPREQTPVDVPEIVMKSYRCLSSPLNVRSIAGPNSGAAIDWLAASR